MSESAVQYHRIVDALSVGNVLSSGDAEALKNALILAEKNGISIETGLKWGSRWRVDVRIMNVLASLSELRTGKTFSGDAVSIRNSPGALRSLTAANGGKEPGERVLRRWLSELAKLSH